MEEVEDSDLVVYVVWSDQLGAEERHVADAAALIPDPRVHQYWDPGRLAGSAFQDRVGTQSAAWDVWLLFGHDARWTSGSTPEPAWWSHQLAGMPPDRRLDPGRFAERAKELLDSLKGSEDPTMGLERGAFGRGAVDAFRASRRSGSVRPASSRVLVLDQGPSYLNDTLTRAR